MKQTDFAWAITKYLSEYLPGQRNVSTNTMRSYRDTCKQLIIFLNETYGLKPERIAFINITAEHIKNYLNWLEKERKVSISTRNQRLAAIHSFYRYALTEYPDILFESQRILGIKFKKKNHPTIDYLTRDCMGCILEQPDIFTKRGRRDLTLITTLYDTGARVQELIDLKMCDVRLQKPATVLLTGKGDKSRCVPLMDKTKNLLETYMREANLFENGRQQIPLFHNSRYEKFTRPGISYILNKYFNLAREKSPDISFPKTIHPHILRHTKAVHLLEAGVNLIYIRDILGHVSITTTEIYLKAETELKRNALENAYPQIVSQDIPLWTKNTELIQWLKDFCS
ncbi:MAG: integrase [Firmicutes bacterium HGW-Firmicutes-12]|jgi:site-specific recombinase XerD|nr:MAG: integrase [Firmicutes bacterium HGW-Firmicutes-12]